MSTKIKDFSVSQKGPITTNNNSNSVNVVVNTDSSPLQQPANFTTIPTIPPVQYPPPQEQPEAVKYTFPSMEYNQCRQQTILPKEVSIEQPVLQTETATTVELETVKYERDFYKTLSLALSNILKDNNPKLIANLIDQTGKIIIGGSTLVELIALLTHKETSSIHIQYYDDEPVCFPKIKYLKTVSNIKIDNENFNFKYNAEYNILKDNFNICLDRVIINSSITYN